MVFWCAILFSIAVRAMEPYQSAINAAYLQLLPALSPYMSGAYRRHTGIFLDNIVNSGVIFYHASEPQVVKLRDSVLIVHNKLQSNRESPIVIPLIVIQHWFSRLARLPQLDSWIVADISSHIDTILASITHPLFQDNYGPFYDYYVDMRSIYQGRSLTTRATDLSQLARLAVVLLGKQLPFLSVYMYETSVLHQFATMRSFLIQFVFAARANHFFVFHQSGDYWHHFSQISKMYLSFEACGLRIAELETVRNHNLLVRKNRTTSRHINTLINQSEVFINHLYASGCSLAAMQSSNNQLLDLNTSLFNAISAHMATLQRSPNSPRAIITPSNTRSNVRTRAARHITRAAVNSSANGGTWNFINRIYNRLKVN